MLRPEGLEGDVVLVGRARDLASGAQGDARCMAEAGFLARIDCGASREIRGLRTLPAEPAAAALVGVKASSGFRAALDVALPEHRDTHSLLYLLLDDVPVATLVSGYAVGAGGVQPPFRPKQALQHPDLCAGWKTGGTIMVEIETEGRVPVVTGPLAPSLARPADPLAWHAMDALPAHGMRRHRRLDLVAEGDLHADVLFRDSHMSEEGHETIVHEYNVRARIDPATLEILEIEAIPHALPWVECAGAAASAERLVGRPVPGLRPQVRAEFIGPPTCTHLNDTLRSLADVTALAATLSELRRG